MFPGPNATVYYNEAGEPLGWDYPAEPEGPYDGPLDYVEPDPVEVICPDCEAVYYSDEAYCPDCERETQGNEREAAR